MGQWQKIPSLDNKQFAFSDGNYIRRSFTAIKERDLAKNITSVQKVEYGILSFGRVRYDFHLAFEYGEQAGSRISLGKHSCSARGISHPGTRPQLNQQLRSKDAENRVLAKKV